MTGLPLVREKSGKFKVREKSGNFEKIQGNLEFWKKSGKFAIGQGNFEVFEDILPMRMTHCGLVLQEYHFCVICGKRCSGYFPNFIEMSCLTGVFVQTCVFFTCFRHRESAVKADVGSSGFTDLKISVKSVKSQGNLTSSTSGNPVNYSG